MGLDSSTKREGHCQDSKSLPEMISKKISKNPTAQKKNQNKITLRDQNYKINGS
jgi:hypothetical protein